MWILKRKRIRWSEFAFCFLMPEHCSDEMMVTLKVFFSGFYLFVCFLSQLCQLFSIQTSLVIRSESPQPWGNTHVVSTLCMEESHGKKAKQPLAANSQQKKKKELSTTATRNWILPANRELGKDPLAPNENTVLASTLV